jgi:hypothetical protein
LAHAFESFLEFSEHVTFRLREGTGPLRFLNIIKSTLRQLDC